MYKHSYLSVLIDNSKVKANFSDIIETLTVNHMHIVSCLFGVSKDNV